MAEKDRNWLHNRRNLAFLAAAVLVAVSIGIKAGAALRVYIDEPTRDFILAYDVDWAYLNQGLGRIHSFADTARWWTGA